MKGGGPSINHQHGHSIVRPTARNRSYRRLSSRCERHRGGSHMIREGKASRAFHHYFDEDTDTHLAAELLLKGLILELLAPLGLPLALAHPKIDGHAPRGSLDARGVVHLLGVGHAVAC